MYPLSSEFASFRGCQFAKWRASQRFAVRPSICQSRLHPFRDQRSFELGNCSDHLKHQFTRWQRGIHGLRHGNKIDSQCSTHFESRDQLRSDFWRSGRISRPPRHRPIPVDKLSTVRSEQAVSNSHRTGPGRDRSSATSSLDAGRTLAVPVPALPCPARSCSLGRKVLLVLFSQPSPLLMASVWLSSWRAGLS